MKIKLTNLPFKTLPKDGDVNLTEICKKAGKQLNHYFDNKGKTLEYISKATNIPPEELIYRVKINGIYNTWGNEIFKIFIEEWANKNKINQIEKEIRERLKSKLGGEPQATRIGQIDLLTKREIIEIKVIDKWKEGVGQLILFGKIYPNHSKRLQLFGNFPTRIKPELSTELLTIELIKEFCNDFNITVIIDYDESREKRIKMEIIVDAYTEEERAMGWYYYLDDKLNFPFKAKWINRKGQSEEVEVQEISPEDDCGKDMFVEVLYREGEAEDVFSVPLYEIEAIDADPETQAAITDWHYWVERGNEL